MPVRHEVENAINWKAMPPVGTGHQADRFSEQSPRPARHSPLGGAFFDWHATRFG
jgi:hypothetical protein